MATFDELITSLRQEFGEAEAGKKFEVFCKWFLENDPEWSRAIDKVWLWDEYPNKWQRQDLGTDLVFRDKEGLIWAVQAKCYSEHRSTTKGDMNSFLADTGRPEVDRRLWLQTTNKIEAKALKTCKGQDKPVTFFNLNNFREAQIDYPSSFSELGLAKVKEKPTPDPHQESAIQDVVSGFEAADRGQMIMACGTGKTFTTLWIKEALEAETTLVLLPSLSLLSQTMREWAWAGNTDFAILNICSDKSVGRKTEDMDPADAAFPVTSDLNEITAFLKRPDAKVVFCTYQSSDLISQAQLDEAIPAFDLAIADEAHRCAGKADAGFATILDGSKIRASKRLFTTATPRYAGKSVKDAGKVRDVSVVGMDDETVFGPVLHKLTFGQAIDYKPEPLLNDYQVVIIGVDEPMVREWIDNYEIVSTDPDKQTDARTLAAKIGLIKAIKDYDLERVISFHSRVKGAEEFSEEIATVLELVEPENRPDGEFLSDYVSGAMAAGDRKEKIDRLKQLEGYDRGILTNARCLAEGVDVPSLDGIAFIDPKSSQIDIIQAVGRAIRKVRGEAAQKKGTIVLPVFIEDGDDHEAVIEASNFKPVWEVLKALRAHDEILAETLDRYRTNMAKNTSQLEKRVSDKIIFDIPRFVDPTFAKALRTVLAEATTASWEFWFGLLERYKEENGNVDVPADHKLAGYKLGNWVHQQRGYFTQGILQSQRISKLDALGFTWRLLEDKWHLGLKAFIDFVNREGHPFVPASHIENGFRLGNWVQNQKPKKKLSLDRVNALEAAGYVWDRALAQFLRNLNRLKRYANGKSPNIQQTENDGGKPHLGHWLGTRRREFRDGQLDEFKQKKLEEIGVILDLEEEQWRQNFEMLKNFVELNETLEIAATAKDPNTGFNIGAWLKRQIELRESGDLEPRRDEKLQELGISVAKKIESNGDKWSKPIEELTKYITVYKNGLVPKIYKTKEGYALGQWVQRTRTDFENLSSKTKKRLLDAGFVTDRREYVWQENFLALRAYKSEHGNCDVPQRYPSYVNSKNIKISLGTWLHNQRTYNDLSKLPPHRKDLLDNMGVRWRPALEEFDESWDRWCELLRNYRETYGDFDVPIGYVTPENEALGQWVYDLKRSKRKISEERRKQLEKIGYDTKTNGSKDAG